MSSGSSSLPPAALSKAQSQARIDQIAVRIINLPENLRNNPAPVKISGTVSGQNPDGSVDVKTDRGELSILLRDKGNLPQGKQIEVEIPAGRNPQQASIRASENQTSQSSPSMAQAISSQDESMSQTNQLKQNQKLVADTLGGVIVSTQSETTEIQTAPSAIPIAGGNLLPGQPIRLVPIPPGTLPQDVRDALTKPPPLPETLNLLVSFIESLPKDQAEPRTTLITILSRLDLSPLHQGTAPQTTGTSVSQHHSHQSDTPLLDKIKSLIQPIEITTNSTNKTIDPETPFTPPNSNGTPFTLINPSKTVDGQILALQTQNQATTTAQQILFNVIQSVKPDILQNAPISLGQFIGNNQEGLPILALPLPHTGLTQIYTLQFKATNLGDFPPVLVALNPQSVKQTQTLFTQLPDGSVTLNPETLSANSFSWAPTDNWDTLDTLLKTLIHIAPQQGQALSQMLPNPAQPHNMAPLSLFFLSMMKTGNIENWMGSETTALLRQFGKLEALRNASADLLSAASRLELLPLPQDWKMALLPLLWENQVYKAPVYYKHFPEEGEKDEAEAKKRRKLRFLFDLSLSRMGAVQVDGFMQSAKLDIILRTKSPLSQPMQSQMRRLYAGAMDKSRLTGELSFQSRPDQWVDFGGNFEKTGVTV